MNPARIAALRLGMGEAMTAFTVQINCGSGMQSIDTAYQYIREGKSDLILAGGTDALSWSPLLFRKRAVDWYARLFGAPDIWARLKALAEFRPSFLKPVIGLELGLTDPVVELNMGQTAEIVGHLFHISRREADEYAAESQQRLARAQKDGSLDRELEPAFRRDALALGDIGVWELNEAFAAQVLACLAVWEDDTFCREVLGLDGAAGRIDRDKFNVDGGAIGLGHPVGASGNRIVLHLVNAMKRHGVKQGIATECIGGGQGGAMLIEAVS